MIEAVAAVGAGAGYGTANFLGGLAAIRQPVLQTLLVSQAAALLLVTGAAAGLSGHAGGAELARGLAVGAGAGTAAFAGAYLTYACFRSAQLGISAVLLGTAQVAVAVTAGTIAGAAPRGATLAGLGLAAVAVVLLALPDRTRRTATGPRAAALAAGAGVAFGGYHSAMATAPRDSGLWPVVAAEAVIVLLAAAALLIRVIRGQRWAGGMASALAAADGLASAVATVAGLTAVRSAALPVAGALIAVVPAGVAVVLARVVLGQRLGARLAAGVGVAAAAVVLLSADRTGFR